VPDADPIDTVERELAVVVRRARGRWAQIAREVHPDLEPAAYGLLLRIEEVGAARVTDLAAYFGVGKPTLSRQVQLLERLGLVGRSADASDGRAQSLVLTEDGRRRVRRVRDARRAQMRGMLATWPPDEIATLGTLLARFNELMAARV
jgi:DNA-binding MarR family transcriptional regulator